jgi:predicted dinucleotide-binding enzyme
MRRRGLRILDHRQYLRRSLVIVGARPCHQVTVADSRGPASLADLSAETGAQAAEIEEAVRGQEVVVVAVPMKNPEPAPRRGLAAVNPGFQVDLVISDIVRDMEDWIELPIRVASCMAA